MCVNIHYIQYYDHTVPTVIYLVFSFNIINPILLNFCPNMTYNGCIAISLCVYVMINLNIWIINTWIFMFLTDV